MTGITGAAVPDYSKVTEAVTRIKSHTELPVAVGFGVKTAENAAAVAAHADGVVVGTALISVPKQSLDENDGATERTVPDITAYVADLARGVHGARTGARR